MCLGALLAIGLTGCSKILGIEDFSLTPDAPPDVPGPDAQLCWGSGLAPVCLTAPAMGVKILDMPLDTDTLGTCTDIIAQPAGPELCVIAANQINISNTVTATGTRPLMLIATDTINIGGTLDVSSKRTAAKPGAGANFNSCGAGTAPLNNSTAAGGGAGGTFGTKGSNGGDGFVSLALVNNNGVAPAVLGLTFVRGGCKGQDGGDNDTVQGGTGGSSGGAVYLFAATSITVDGNIYASGAGATAAGAGAGGGGGGGGGLIGLEAPTINVTGIIAANGGNGGAGGSSAAGAAGTDGATMLYNTQPAAAAGANGGGSGGRGTTGPTPTASTVGGNGSVSPGAGGGGGGGTGIVWVKGALTGTMIAPTPTLN